MANALTGIRSIGRSWYARLTGKHFGGDRDLWSVFGYRENLEPEEYVQIYKRGDIAGRIIDAYPDATWREQPKFVDADGGEKLQTEIDALDRKMGFWSSVHRLDRLMNLGHYGVMVVGLTGGEPMSTRVTRRDHELLYLHPYGENHAQVQAWYEDPTSASYGRPERYRVTTGVNWTGTGGGERSLNVHASRTVHVAEGALDDQSIGLPRLERIMNRLFDLEKLLGGSAEVYWQNAAMLRSWIADPDTEWDPKAQADMEEQFEELMHGLRRDLRLRGVKGESLASEPADPQGQVGSQLDIIAGAIGIPKRILIGSERGELSSEQDENNWAARIGERREQFAGPNMIRPLVRKLQNLGVLKYRDEFTMEWPDTDALGDDARSEIALKRSQALQAYSQNPSAELIIPREEFRKWVGEDPESEFDIDEVDIDGEIDEQDPQVVSLFSKMRTNAGARTLYVRRNVENANEIRAWAKSQGITKRIPAGDMHVTIALSKQPLDWMKIDSGPLNSTYDGIDNGVMTIGAGGVRLVERMGPKALCLLFTSNGLSWRHREIIEAGASWDWPSYQPHITITMQADDIDVDAIEPYRGPIILGPEIFEEITEDWADEIVENSR